MPNWFYLILQLFYDLALAIWIGGALVLGAATAPALFKALPKQQAGAIFGPILARFARMRAFALLMIVVSAGARFLIWERHVASLWLIGRWTAIVLLAWSLLGEMSIQRQMRVFGANLGPESEDNPMREYFQFLHVRAEGVMKASVIAAVIALVFS